MLVEQKVTYWANLPDLSPELANKMVELGVGICLLILSDTDEDGGTYDEIRLRIESDAYANFQEVKDWGNWGEMDPGEAFEPQGAGSDMYYYAEGVAEALAGRYIEQLRQEYPQLNAKLLT